MLLLVVQVINFNFGEEFFFSKVVLWIYRRWLGMLTQIHFNG